MHARAGNSCEHLTAGSAYLTVDGRRYCSVCYKAKFVTIPRTVFSEQTPDTDLTMDELASALASMTTMRGLRA